MNSTVHQSLELFSPADPSLSSSEHLSLVTSRENNLFFPLAPQTHRFARVIATLGPPTVAFATPSVQHAAAGNACQPPDYTGIWQMAD